MTTLDRTITANIVFHDQTGDGSPWLAFAFDTEPEYHHNDEVADALEHQNGTTIRVASIELPPELVLRSELDHELMWECGVITLIFITDSEGTQCLFDGTCWRCVEENNGFPDILPNEIAVKPETLSFAHIRIDAHAIDNLFAIPTLAVNPL